MRRRLLGQVAGGAPVIPTPEAGVCTVYPIPIPVTSGLISYVSAFNSCDQFQVNDRSLSISADGDYCSYVDDISGIGNDWRNRSSIPSSTRGAIYNDNGGGDVFWSTDIASAKTSWQSDINWRLNSDVKTILILCQADSNALNIAQRMGPHYSSFRGYARTNAGKLEFFQDGIMTSSLITANTWFVMSIRVNNNVVLGVDKTYEEVSASAPSNTSSDFTLWAVNTNAGSGYWEGKMREIAIYSGNLSDTDTDTMVDYMKDKWGL